MKEKKKKMMKDGSVSKKKKKRKKRNSIYAPLAILSPAFHINELPFCSARER